MSQERDIVTTLATELIHVLEPLREAFADTERFKGFLYTMGWEATGLPAPYVELAASVTDAVKVVEDLGDGDVDAGDLARLISTIKDLYDRVNAISTAPPGVNGGAFLAEIGERLLELLLTEYLSRHQPTWYNAFAALDVISQENLPADANKLAHARTRFKWEEIPKILQDPLSIVQRVYGWGTPELDTAMLFGHLSGLLHSLQLPVNLIAVDDATALTYAGATEFPFARRVRGLKIPFHYATIGDKQVEFSLEIMELPASGGHLPGLVIQPGIPSEIPAEFRFGEFVTLSIRAGSDIANRFGVLIRPDDGISVKYPFQDGTSFPTAGFSANIDYRPGEPSILLGTQGGVRLESKGAQVGLEIFSQSGEFEVKGFSEIHDLALILAPGQGDGFLQTILGSEEIRVGIPLGVDWSSKTGFGFRGSMNFSIALHPHLSLGPIEIPQFQLSLEVPSGVSKPRIDIEAGININGNLGPLKVVVEEIGLGLYTTFESGNLGPLDLDVGFKPPNGVGLSVDAGVVKGGGYLYLNYEKEEYAGALELVFSGFLTLKAIGLITTRMPDGSKGFSLLIIITAEFGTPIQLSFGFTLNAVGGLLGLNRTMMLQPLAEGVRTGAINSVMFPVNVVENAPRIISDLRGLFPPHEGIFIIGPMAKIGWGTPSLVTLSLGIMIEIPGNIAILGVLRVCLPDEAVPLLVLQVNFIGAIDFDKKEAWFFAGMFESRVLTMTIEGEMGVLVAWGDDPNFVISVGGFHPAFKAPPLPFPEPRRIAISILNTDFARIRVEGYFAVTSNTVQFGARAELYFGLDAFRIEGHLAFDALFRFSPFSFIITISASLSVKVFGVGLFSVRFKGELEGPTPWRVKGSGSISLLFFDIDVDFSHTWGEEADTTLPPIKVVPLLVAEIERTENWKTILPGQTRLFVSLRELEQSNTLVLHPVGTLQISQRAVPLELTLDKVGNQKPEDADYFTLSVSSPGLAKSADVSESFALAQFKDMDDAKKLSSPAFEKLKAGIELSAATARANTSLAVKRVVRYEKIIVDTNYLRFVRPLVVWFADLFALFLNGNAVARSAVSQHTAQQKRPFADKVTIGRDVWVVSSNMDNSPLTEGPARFTSQAEAYEHMQQIIAEHPEQAEEVHVIPESELRSAA